MKRLAFVTLALLLWVSACIQHQAVMPTLAPVLTLPTLPAT